MIFEKYLQIFLNFVQLNFYLILFFNFQNQKFNFLQFNFNIFHPFNLLFILFSINTFTLTISILLLIFFANY